MPLQYSQVLADSRIHPVLDALCLFQRAHITHNNLAGIDTEASFPNIVEMVAWQLSAALLTSFYCAATFELNCFLCEFYF